MKLPPLAALLVIATLAPAFAITEAEIAPAALVGKTLTFTVETGAAPFATSGSFTGTFGAAPGNVFTKTRVTGDATTNNGTWSFNSSFSGMYEYTIVHFLAGRPNGILTLWISGGAGRYEVFLDGVFGNSQTGGFTIGGGSAAKSPEINVLKDGAKLTDGSSKVGFGVAKTGKSVTKKLVVKNSGKAKLTGLAITKNGANKADFTVAPLPKTSLAPGASMNLTVTFKPGSAGKKAAAIHLKSNDADESPFDIKLAGEGVK